VNTNDLQNVLPGEDWHRSILFSSIRGIHARQKGVDCNMPPLAIFVEAYTNETRMEKVLADKELVDQLRLLRCAQDGQGREKIAVA
jgi:hypothetical protein